MLPEDIILIKNPLPELLGIVQSFKNTLPELLGIVQSFKNTLPDLLESVQSGPFFILHICQPWKLDLSLQTLTRAVSK